MVLCSEEPDASVRLPVRYPRKWGSGGQMTVSARCAKALTGINPQRIFGYFLCEQKVTSVSKQRNPPRRAEPSPNKPNPQNRP